MNINFKRCTVQLGLIAMMPSLVVFPGCKTTEESEYSSTEEPNEYIAKLTTFSPPYFLGEYITESESISVLQDFSSTPKRIVKTKKLSKEDVLGSLKMISEVGVYRWSDDYGSHKFFDQDSSDLKLPSSPPFSWEFHIKSYGEFPEVRSMGRGMFPGDKNPVVPQGPDPSDSFRYLSKVFVEICPNPWVE